MMGIFRFLLGTGSNRECSNASMHVSNELNHRPKPLNRTISVSDKIERLASSSRNFRLTVKQLDVAEQLMRSGEFELCIQAYKNIAKQNPDKTGKCNSQIGAALYYLGRYEEAVCHYNKSSVQNKVKDP